MQPSLTLTYSNEGGSSWVGYGWNLSAPSISIDTRWGVPRFDPNYETELYSYGGNHLVYPGNYLPHRTFTQYNDSTGAPMYARMSGTVRFFEQNTRTYKTIERKGTSTSGYFWVITDSEGTKQYYGTTDGASQDAGSVLKNAQGHAVDWKLTKVIDKWGNYMTYEYTAKSYTTTGNDIVDGSTALVLEKITYTGHDSDPGKYSVEFALKTWSSSNYRVDGQVSNRLGSAHADIETLDKVVIKYNGTEVKHYQLGYTQGAFYKNLLATIAEVRSGKVFTVHDLDYYQLPGEVYKDSVRGDNSLDIVTVSRESAMENTDLMKLIKGEGNRDYYTGKSPLGTTTNMGFSISGRYGIGLVSTLTAEEAATLRGRIANSIDFNDDASIKAGIAADDAITNAQSKASKAGTIGGNVAWNYSRSRATSSLIDVDGDGLLDVVKKDLWGKVYYRKLTISGDSISLGSTQPLDNLWTYNRNYSNTLNFGLDLHGYDWLPMDFGISFNKAWNNNDVYFLDYNRDGIIDILNPKKEDGGEKLWIAFGNYNLSTNKMSFSSSSEHTPSPVIKGRELNYEPNDDFTMFAEVVKSWTAPKAGTILIYDTISFVGNSDDYVRYGIQKANGTSSSFVRSFSTISSTTNILSTTSVDSGEVVFFRLRPRSNGIEDEVNINPHIQYSSDSAIGPDGIDWYNNSSSDGFKLSAQGGVSLSLSETYSVGLPSLSVNSPSDDLLFFINHYGQDSLGFKSLHVASATASANTTTLINSTSFGSLSLDHDSLIIDGQAYVSFSVLSSSNIDWKSVDWRPYLYNSYDTIYPIVHYGMYNNLRKFNDPKDITASIYQNATTLKVKRKTSYTSWGLPSGLVGIMVVKADSKLIGKVKFETDLIGFKSGGSTVTFSGADLTGHTNLFVEYYTSNKKLADFLKIYGKYDLEISGATDEINIDGATVFSNNLTGVLGHNYLNWGQFAWQDSTEGKINLSDLGLYKSVDSIYTPSGLGLDDETTDFDTTGLETMSDKYSVFSQKFLPLLPLRKEEVEMDSLLYSLGSTIDGESRGISSIVPDGTLHQDRYTHIDRSIFVAETRSAPGYVGQNTLPELSNDIPHIVSQYNAVGGQRKSTSFTGSWNRSKGLSSAQRKGRISLTSSLNQKDLFFSRGKIDFFDLNGDGFPDQLITKKSNDRGIHIIYSNALGGFSDSIRIDSTSFSLDKTRSNSVGLRLAGIPDITNDIATKVKANNTRNTEANIPIPIEGLGGTVSTTTKEFGWMDVNGDGLSDYIRKDGNKNLYVHLNTGYGLDTNARYFSTLDYEDLAKSIGVSFSVSTPDYSNDINSYGFGAGLSGSSSRGLRSYVDINGDGLQDQIFFSSDSVPYIKVNTGTKYVTYSKDDFGYNPKVFSKSYSGGVSGSYTKTFPLKSIPSKWPFLEWKQAVTLGFNLTTGMQRVHYLFADINGDGFTDFMRNAEPDKGDPVDLGALGLIDIWTNNNPNVNRLKRVTNPLGGSFELTYDLVGNKYGTYPNEIEMENANDDSTYWDMPNSKWVLKTVTVDDGFDLQDDSNNDIDGTDSFTTVFNYDGGIYSRRNRAFMYFTKVETVSPGGLNRSVVVHRAPTSNGTVANRQYAYYGAVPIQTYGFAQGTGVGYWETVSRATNRIKVYPVHTTGTSQGQVDVTNELWVDTLAEDLVVFIAMDSTVSTQNPVIGGSTAFSQSQKLEYDSYMNVTKAIDGGLDGEIGTSDDLVSTMTYFTPSNAAGRTGQIEEHKVYKQVVSSNNMLRHSKVQQLTSGSLAAKELRRYLNATDFAQSDCEYDTYGNITKMTGPENASAQRDTVNVTYDNVVHTYPIKVENAFGDYTQSTYDYSTGQVLTSEDLNGNQIQYTYDDFFRIEKILGPKEDHGNPDDFTIRYQYFPQGRHPESATWEDRVPVAVTYHYQDQGDASNANYVSGINDDVVANPGIKEYTYNSGMWVATMETSKNHLMTATFSDGLGRAVQIKKDISVWNGLQQVESRQVSGATKIDVRGLPTSQYLSVSEQNDETVFPLLRFNRTLSSINPTTTSYDYLGRAVSVSSPDAAGTGSYTATVAYGWETKSSDDYFVTTSTDPDGRKNKAYVDARGQQRFTVADPNGVNAETEFFYDVLGQLTSTQSVDGETTSFTYDKFGRVTQEVHPDRGTTTTEYDLLGQVVSTTNANGQQVDYDYNYSRLTDISYPTSGNLNDISYTYGSRGDGINGAGRVTEITQGLATAPVLVEKMNYDELGNVAVHTREIDIPIVGIQSFTSKTQYDSWGRILKMTYPDGEQVRYFHSFGGDLFRINGYNLGNTVLTVPSESYVKQLGYDQYGNRTYMEYGNGTKTTFEYNANTLRLNEVTALTSALNSTGMAQGMISKTFDYTGAGNIIEINNAATHVNFPYNNLGGGYNNLYAYDGLNRLTNATGDWLGATGPENYSVSMTYDNMGGIVQKNQTASLNYPGYPGEKYNYYYTQGNTAHPHATSKVWDRRNHKQYTYGFDSNGNPTTTHEQYAPPLQGQPNPSGPIDLIQQNYWDEQNQLRGLWNLSGLHHYIYDADGQRLMKSSVPMSYSSVNAQQLQATNSIAAEDYTVYVSAGLVYESNRGSTTYTKHYYAGPLRVASQIGSENPNYETHPVSGGNIAPGGPANTTPESYGVAVLSDLNTLLANYGMAVDANEPPQDTLSMQVINDPDECRMFFGDDVIEENRCLCDNFPDIAIQQGIDCNPFTPIYWYHPDYIGNIEFVTDRTGQPYQHFYYAAFGDPMVSQHVGTGSFNSTFRFNAKEFDEETGNYYYGARYYEPKSSVWMGVDAMATSYPGMNPYNFTMGNPIMAIDPDGNDTTIAGWFVNLYEGTIEQHKDGVTDPFDQALVYLGPNDATVSDIYSSLEAKGFEHRIVEGGQRVDTYTQYKAWVTFKVFGEGLPPVMMIALGTGGLTSSNRVFGPQLPTQSQALIQAAKGSVTAANGLKIGAFTEHGLNRAIGSAGRKGVKPDAILDALKNPLKINDVVIDQLGRPSQRFIGRVGEVVVNPHTGKIISVNPTSSSKAERLLKQIVN